MIMGLALASCSGESSPQRSAPPLHAAGGSSSAGAAGAAGTVPIGTSTSGGAAIMLPPPVDGGVQTDPACTGEAEDSARLPLDMYFLVDTSGSMGDRVAGGSKWEVVSQALVTFLKDPANADIGVGIGYFPQDPPLTCHSGDPDCTCFNLVGFELCFPQAGGSCNVTDYATPAVALSLLIDHAPVIADIARHDPRGGTPTRPALEGALQHVASWVQTSHRKGVIVLATDGDPTGCSQNTPQDVANVARAALAGSAAIQTFVVGVGKSLTSLNLIAQAGGTEKAILVDTGGNLGQAISEAFQQIRGKALPCAYRIPPSPTGQVLDPQKVNVRYTPLNATEAQIIPMTRAGDPANCDASPGWYYDNPTAPTAIELCPSSCQSLMDGRVEVEFGCQTIVR